MGLDLRGMTYSKGARAMRSGNTLVVRSGGGIETFLLSNSDASTFYANNDGAGGVFVTAGATGIVASSAGPAYDAAHAVASLLTIYLGADRSYSATVDSNGLHISNGVQTEVFPPSDAQTSYRVNFSANAAAVNLAGGASGDILSGGSDADTLDGGVSGADRLYGGAGNDTFLVSHTGVAAIENAGEGVDLVMSSVGFTLGANVEDLTLTGTGAINGTGNALDNVVVGNAGNNILSGGTGNDTLTGGLGDDRLIGGDGIDAASYASATGAVTVSLALTTAQKTGAAGTDTLTQIETLIGSAYDDTLTGNSLDNRLDGGLGADLLSGGSGNDMLLGGGGNNTLYGEAGNDTLIGGDDNDVLEGRAGTNLLYGGNGNDRLVGGVGNDLMDGGAGDDTIVGTTTSTQSHHSGVAAYSDATGAVTVSLAIVGAQNTDGAGTDTLVDVANLIGSNYGDTLTGDANDNILQGRDGNDTLNGGGGKDTLYGGDGNDLLIADNFGAVLDGGAGSDTLRAARGGAASYADAKGGVTVTLATTAFQNTVNAGSDRLVGITDLIGSSYNDTLTGDTGLNTLEGGKGADLLTGGSGADRFLYRDPSASTVAASGRDLIADFSAAHGDTIDLSQMDADVLTAGQQIFRFLGTQAFDGTAGALDYAVMSGTAYVCGDVNGDRAADFSIAVANTASLKASDFTLVPPPPSNV